MQTEQAKERLPGFDPRTIFEKAPDLQPGTADLVVGGEALQVLSRMAAYYLNARNENRQRYFSSVVIIMPPKLVWDVSDDAIHAALIKGVEDIQGTPLSAEVARRFLTVVDVVRCEQLDVAEVSTYVSSDEKKLFLVPSANKYRDHTLVQSWALGRAGALFPEDVWAPHVARLATACLAVARPRGSVIVFSVTGESLVRDKNIQLLNDVEDLYPVVLGYEGQPNNDDLFAKLVPRWAALATSGRAKQAYEELGQSAFDDSLKQQVALQLAVRAGDTDRDFAPV